jgi:hypothetical protein
MIANILKNWKTSLAGLGILLATLGNAIGQYSGGGFANVDLKVLLAGLAGAAAAFSAKDSNVTGGTVPNAVPPAIPAP